MASCTIMREEVTIRSQIDRLCCQGLLGFFTHIEVTEIVAFVKGCQSPLNAFTIMVAEEREPSETEEPNFVNDEPISLPSLKGWKFGVYRYIIPIEKLAASLDDLCDRGLWQASGNSLQLGAVELLAPQFVPPNSTRDVPWNKVLKNNFWNGSYVFEWADAKKALLKPLFDDPRRLHQLSTAVAAHAPISIGSLSDKIGNIVLQIPSSICMAKFARVNPGGAWIVQIGWHPDASPRPLLAACDVEFDDTVVGYATCLVQQETTNLPLSADHGLHEGYVWDDNNSLLLSATGPSAFVSTIGLRMGVVDPEPRVFSAREADGTRVQQRVGLVSVEESIVGRQETENDVWTKKRMYRDETARLAAERRFVQYRPQPGQQEVEHENAIGDIRTLIDQHGEGGAWLWDPYLSAHDIIATLFYCTYAGADLRGLTAALTSAQGGPASAAAFVEQQRQEFADAQSNLRGLRLEYRAKIGPRGWGFHDRFLILPRKDRGAFAWSLGTSVNSLGKQHHILQRVDDGQRIMDAFLELWNELDTFEHLILKTP